MSDRESLDTGLRSIFASLAAGSHTALIGMVQSYNSATMRAEVQPVQMKFVNEIPTALPVLVDVPVLFPSNGSFHVVFNLNPGTFVLCVIAEHAIDQWLALGSIAPPGNSRRCDLSDAVAIPGLFPTPGILVPPCAPGALEIRNSLGTSIISITDTEVQIQGSTDWAVAYTDLKIAFDSLKSSLNAFIGVYNAHSGHTTGAVPSTPAVAATADMTAAKVINVRLP